MWILFRLVVAIVAFAVRQLHRPKKPKGDEMDNGRMRYVRVHRHKGAIKGFSLGVALDAPFVFDLSRETARDRFFKKIGLSTEMETGDRAFDDRVYVMCDHPMLGTLLKRSAEARAKIRAVLDDGFDRIRFDGHVVWVNKSAPREPADHEERLLGELAEALAPLERDKSSRLADPFLWKALIVEGVVWSFAGYALASLFGMFLQQEDIHLDQRALFVRGMILAAALFASLLALTVALLRGSSRGHRVILESALVLLLTVPFSGWQGVADLNRGLDPTSVAVFVPIEQCETRVSTSRRRGRTRTTTNYYLHIAERTVDGIAFPSTLKTRADVCHAMTPGVKAQFVLGRGALGLPWIREVRAPGYRWSS